MELTNTRHCSSNKIDPLSGIEEAPYNSVITSVRPKYIPSPVTVINYHNYITSIKLRIHVVCCKYTCSQNQVNECSRNSKLMYIHFRQDAYAADKCGQQ